MNEKVKITLEGESCHVCGMWIEIKDGSANPLGYTVMPRMWHVD